MSFRELCSSTVYSIIYFNDVHTVVPVLHFFDNNLLTSGHITNSIHCQLFSEKWGICLNLHNHMKKLFKLCCISLLLLIPFMSVAETAPAIKKRLTRKQRKEIRKQRRQQKRIKRVQKFLRSKKGQKLQRRILKKMSKKRAKRKQGFSIIIGLIGLLLILGTIVWLVNGSLLLIWIALGLIGLFLLIGLLALLFV